MSFEIFKPLYILGAGGFAREVACLFPDQCFTCKSFQGYLSDDKAQYGQIISGGVILGTIEDIPNEVDEVYFIPGIGSPFIREKLVNRALARNWKPYTAISHNAFIGMNVVIGNGSVICSHNSITCDIKIGNYVNLNLNCTVGHDTIIEDYCNLSPGCLISGHVHIERSCDLGTGVNVLPGLTIGEGCIIGAGATVTKDIPPFSLAVGTPAIVKKSLK